MTDHAKQLEAFLGASILNEEKLEQEIAREVHNILRRLKKPIIDAQGIVPKSTWEWWDCQGNRDYEDLHPDGRMQLYMLAQHLIDQSKENNPMTNTIRQLLADYQQAVEALETYSSDNWSRTGFEEASTGKKLMEIKSIDGGRLADSALAASDNWKPLMEKTHAE